MHMCTIPALRSQSLIIRHSQRLNPHSESSHRAVAACRQDPLHRSYGTPFLHRSYGTPFLLATVAHPCLITNTATGRSPEDVEDREVMGLPCEHRPGRRGLERHPDHLPHASTQHCHPLPFDETYTPKPAAERMLWLLHNHAGGRRAPPQLPSVVESRSWATVAKPSRHS